MHMSPLLQNKNRKKQNYLCLYVHGNMEIMEMYMEIFGKSYTLNRNTANNTVKILLQIINKDYI